MAIVIQQEKNNGNWLFIFSVLFIFAIIGISAYYVFFEKPEAIERVIPQQLQTISELEKLNLDPNDLLKDQRFSGLQKSIQLNIPDSSTVGKANPFR